MRLTHVRSVTKREYLARLKSKGFWISTIALPVLMAAWAILPGLMMAKTTAGQRLAVVDETGRIAERLQIQLEEWSKRSGDLLEGGQPVRFDLEIIAPGNDHGELRRELDHRVLEQEIDAWIWIDDELLAEDRVEYHAESVSNFITQEVLGSALSRVVRTTRLEEAGYDAEVVAQLSRSVDLETIRLSEMGSEAETGVGGFAIAFGLFMILYMTTLIYGQQVMHGVLEEKSSRVVEVILAAIQPIELLAGKLIGICLAGLTQLAIWIGTLVVLTAPGVVALIAFMPAGIEVPKLPASLVVHFFLFFLLGYFFYATFYAMIGSAFNNSQEAQQMASIGVVFVVAPWIFFLPVLNDPDSTLSVVTSLIPVFTPFLMLLRIAVKSPPAWQIGLGYLLTLLLCFASVWLCARIYRVGILMYGKKPSIREIARWIRYA
ncbi:MAG: ABC transporter permease [Acidobacteriota bacterium]